MTQNQIDKAINTAQDILYQDGIVALKIKFNSKEEAAKFQAETSDDTVRYDNMVIFSFGVYNTEGSFSDASVNLGYFVTLAIYDLQAVSIKVM